MIGTEARQLMRRVRSAALATALATDEGRPYAALVTVACDTDGAPILLLSHLSDHTRNLATDTRAALLFEEASHRANPQTGPRVTVLGRIDRAEEPRLRRRFLARHPGAALYAGFADFHIHRMTIERAHYVAGFARAVWVTRDEFCLDPTVNQTIGDHEDSVLEHMNRDHDHVVSQFAQRLAGRSGDGWVLAGVDADGCDLRRQQRFARLDFPLPVGDLAQLREALMGLAQEARRRAAP